MPKNTRDRTLRYVTPTQGSSLKYGFQSGLTSGNAADFGQTDIIATTPVQNLVIGCNAPKPTKMGKKTPAGSISSFADVSKIATLKTSGYTVVQKAKPSRRPRAGQLSTAYYVTINGLKYAWYMPTNTVAFDPGPIGAKVASTTDTDLVWGCEFPKPPRWKQSVNAGADSVSSFIDPNNVDQASTAGWVLVNSGKFDQIDLASMAG